MRRLWVVSSIQSQHIFPCDTAKLIGYDIPEEIQNKILQKICWMILLYFLEYLSIQNNLHVYITLSKVSKLGFFAGLYFAVFGLNRRHCISPYSVRIRENTDQKKLCIWTLFTQCMNKPQPTSDLQQRIKRLVVSLFQISKLGKFGTNVYGKETFSAVCTQVLQDLFRLNTSLVFAQPFSSVILLSFPFQIFSKL